MAKAKRPKAPTSPTKADPYAALVCTIVFILSALRVPELLGLSTAQVTGIGSAVVAVAAASRAVWHYRKGEKVSVQDPIAAALGALVLAASLLGLPNASEIDGSAIAMIAASMTGLLTYMRGRQAAHPAAA